MKKFYLIVILLLVLLPAIVSAATYYASISGSDSNTGTISSPFRTIKRSLTAMHGGDTLYIRGGTYQEQNSIGDWLSGTESAPTTISGYPGETAIIDGNNFNIPSKHSGSGLIQVYANWFVVKDLTLTHSGDTGINAVGAHVTLDRIFSHHNWGSGIVMSGNYDLVQNSRAWYNSMMNEGWNMSISWGLGITCARYPDYCTIRNCTAWENWGEGISTFESMHTTIEDCTSYDNGLGFYLSDTKHSVLRRNLAYCSPGNRMDNMITTRGYPLTQSGIFVGDEKGLPIPLGASGTRYPSSDNMVLNNLVFGCDRNLMATQEEAANNLYAYNTFVNADPDGDMTDGANVYWYPGSASGQRFFNNIIVQENTNTPIAHFDQPGIISFSNNLWSSNPPSSALGTSSIVASPQLAKTGSTAAGQLRSSWFNLLSSSPAINKARVMTEVTEDYFKRARDSAPDMGAVEYGGVVSTCTDADGDGYGTNCAAGTDCNDNNAAIHPGATDICGNGIDEDCSGVDLACTASTTYTYYCDRDGDGYINKYSSGACNTAACVPTGCTQTQGNDCFDTDAAIHPGATEVCDDGKDQDCSGADLSCTSQNCIDGTASGACSSSKPLYCESEVLVNRCGNCGCPSGQSCTTGGTCASANQYCSDGTFYNQCSATKPKYCSNGQLINSCSSCGCPTGQTCNTDSSCGSSPPPVVTCTSADWSYSDGACQPSNTLTRTWTKINANCQGGVTHQSTEPVACTYTPFVASGDTYWVSPTGTAAWTACKSTSPLNGASACSLASANANAVAGNTVYLRGGTYYKSLSPAHSGTAANRITFSAYGTEVPTFTVTTDYRWAIMFDNNDYIVVDGIKSYNSLAFFFIGHGSSYNEFKNCVFEHSGGEVYDTGYIVGYNTAFTDMIPSTNNWFHDCVFSEYGVIHNCDDVGTICTSGGYDDTSSNNTFEDCVFYNGGHDAFSVLGRYNVLKNNEFHNEESSYFTDQWRTCPNSPSSGKFGNRAILLENSNTDRYPIPAGVDDMNNPELALPAAQRHTTNYPGTARDTLIEGNRIHHSGTPPDDDGANLIENAGIHTLIRYNDLYAAAANGVYFKTQPYPGASPAAGSTLLKSGSYGRVAFNTIYKTGIGDPDIGSGFKNGMMITGTHLTSFQPWPIDVAFKNNINYDWYNKEFSYPSDSLSQIVYENNYNQNPSFVNPDTSSITSTTAPDLRLQSTSPCINAGTHLTQANGAGSGSTILIIDDAWWFQDGSWGSALTHGVTLFPDWIAIGAVTNVVQIRSIDYPAKRITLASPMTWSNDAPVWLYKNSDGEQVLFGSAPDIGAHEYGSGDVPPSQACSDGTSYNQCSATRPWRCENGQLINRCSTCGCPTGQSCATDGTCVAIPACTDADGDGYGASGTGCSNTGYDCDDNNAAIHLGASETCGNGIDEDCNGVDLQCQQACQASCLASPCGHYESCTIATGSCASGICCSGTCSVPPVAVPTCTEADWKSSDGPCQSQNTMTRSWLKINGNCQGGVFHPESETISCVYVAPPSGLAFEAESGQISSPFNVASSGEITYVFQPAKADISSGGKAVYNFEVTNPGPYVIKAGVNAPTESSNSFYVSIDKVPVDPFNLWDVKSLTRGFRARYVSWKGAALSGAQYDPKVFSLAAGTHKLIVIGKDGNALLNKFEIIPYNASANYGFEPGSGVAGDVDNDGDIGVSDLLAVIYYWHNGGQFGPALDPNGDGIVNVQDVTYIARRLNLN